MPSLQRHFDCVINVFYVILCANTVTPMGKLETMLQQGSSVLSYKNFFTRKNTFFLASFFLCEYYSNIFEKTMLVESGGNAWHLHNVGVNLDQMSHTRQRQRLCWRLRREDVTHKISNMLPCKSVACALSAWDISSANIWNILYLARNVFSLCNQNRYMAFRPLSF